MDQEQLSKKYDQVIVLIQYYVQLMWLVFGAFLVSETVLLGAIMSLAKDGTNAWVFSGSVFGLFLCVPWWSSTQYNHAFYLLRINEAKEMEPTAGTFFTNGMKLFNGETVLGVRIPRFVVLLRSKHAVSILIGLFAMAFLCIALIKWPF